jgi:tRNA(Arg) A34 adenosine deaminase TadA
MNYNQIHEHAIAIAKTAKADSYMHAAVIHKRGRFLVGASNIVHKTHPNGSGRFCTAHAEVRAIIKAKRLLKTDNLKKYSIYVLRVNPRGDIKLSKPCPDCMAFLLKHNLKVAWSGDENG